MEHSTMSLEELKRTKNGWLIWYRIFKKRHQHTKNLLKEEEKPWEVMGLLTAYAFCLNRVERIIDIYSDLINKAELNDLSDREFKTQIFNAKKLNREIQSELDRPKNRELADKYFGEEEKDNAFNL